MPDTLKLEIVTPQGNVFAEDVHMVTLPAIDGQIGVYPHHVRLITQIVPGELVGEIQVLAGGPRTANVHAEGSVRMLRVPREAVIAALEADSRAAMGLIEVLANRFRELA